MFKVRKIEDFSFNGAISKLSDGEITIMPSNITFMMPLKTNEKQTLLRLQNIKEVSQKAYVLMEKPLDSIYDEILALNGKNLGEFKFSIQDSKKRALISLGRVSDGTVHKRFCAVCGFTMQVYHTQVCACKMYPKFEGKINKEKNKITKQSVCLNNDDLTEALGLRFNRFNENWSFRTVSNVIFDETGMAIGDVRVRDKVLKVTTSDHMNELKEKRAVWHSL